MACMFSKLRSIVTGNVIRVLPSKKAYQISRFLPVTTFMPSYPLQNEKSEEYSGVTQINISEQACRLKSKSLKESKLTTVGTILTARPEEDNKFTYNSTGQKNANVEGLCIERLTLTDLEEVNVLIHKAFQSSLHDWGPSERLEDSETSLSKKLHLGLGLGSFIKIDGYFGVRSETSGRFIGALILRPFPLEKKEEEKKDDKEDELGDG
jgi:hypothetical protein